MELPRHNSEYKKQEYWENRYKSEAEYEWLGGYNDFKPTLETFLQPYSSSHAILQLGCGNSSLSADLHKAGWSNITNIDISPVVLSNMQRKERETSGGDQGALQAFLAMDMTQMPFRDGVFDIVIEKATLDSLLVTSDSPWDLSTPECQLVSKALHEVKRVLHPSGCFISITFSQPHFRVPLLCSAGLGWEVNIQTVKGAGLDCFIMCMRAGDPRPALEKYAVSYSLRVEENEDWSSSDEERFLTNLDIISDTEDEEDNSEENTCR